MDTEPAHILDVICLRCGVIYSMTTEYAHIELCAKCLKIVVELREYNRGNNGRSDSATS